MEPGVVLVVAGVVCPLTPCSSAIVQLSALSLRDGSPYWNLQTASPPLIALAGARFGMYPSRWRTPRRSCPPANGRGARQAAPERAVRLTPAAPTSIMRQQRGTPRRSGFVAEITHRPA